MIPLSVEKLGSLCVLVLPTFEKKLSAFCWLAFEMIIDNARVRI